MYVHAFEWIFMDMHIHIYMYIYIHICTYIYLRARPRAGPWALGRCPGRALRYMYVHICMYMYMYICICICVYVHIHIYICIYPTMYELIRRCSQNKADDVWINLTMWAKSCISWRCRKLKYYNLSRYRNVEDSYRLHILVYLWSHSVKSQKP